MRSCTHAGSGAQGESRIEVLERVGIGVEARPHARRRARCCSAAPASSPASRRCWATSAALSAPGCAARWRGGSARAAAAGAPGWSARRPARGASRGRSRRRARPRRVSRTRPWATSSSSAPTVSSSLRPLASRTVSRSNVRPIAAAAPSTWRASCAEPRSGRPAGLRTSREWPPGPPRAGAQRGEVLGTNSGRPSLSMKTRALELRRSRVRPGRSHQRRRRRPRRAGRDCTSVAAPPREQLDGQATQPVARGHRLAAPASTPAAAAGPRAGGRGRRSRPAWPRRRRGRRPRRRRACRRAQAAARTAVTPSSSRVAAPGPSSGRPRHVPAHEASSGSSSDASARRWAGRAGQASCRRRVHAPRAAARRPVRTASPASSSWQRGRQHHVRPLAAGRELVRQARLSDPRLALDHGQAAIRRRRRREPRAAPRAPPRARRAAARRRRRARRRPARPAARAGRGASVPSLDLLESAAVSSTGATPSSWLSVRTHARYCSRRGRAVAAPGVQADQLAVGGLVQRVELQPARGVGDRPLDVAARGQRSTRRRSAGRARARSASASLRPASRRTRAVAQREALEEARRRRVAAPRPGSIGAPPALSARNRCDVELQARAPAQGDAVARRVEPLLADALRRVESVRRSAPRARSGRARARAARTAPPVSAAARRAPGGRAAPSPCACRTTPASPSRLTRGGPSSVICERHQRNDSRRRRDS